MAKLNWDAIGEGIYEAGVDRGVIYPKVGSGLPWNGLINVTHKQAGGDLLPYYFDGLPYMTTTAPEDFSALIESYTYPDELDEDEIPSLDLTYRVSMGEGYKIHLVYNAAIKPTEFQFVSLNSTPQANSFGWDVLAEPVYIRKARQTAHLVIDSRSTESSLLTDLENYLYGSPGLPPKMWRPDELIEKFGTWTRGYGHGLFGHGPFGHGP